MSHFKLFRQLRGQVTFTSLETGKLGRVDFRKGFWDGPGSDQRVPSYDPTNYCGTQLGSSPLVVSKVANSATC